MAFLPEFRGQPAGTWASRPAGILLHGSRGGNPNRQQEFLGTAHWCHTNPDGLSWHVTVGDGAYIQHLTMQEWGWHAREVSKIYIGVEFTQPTVNDAITDEQVAAFAKWYQDVVAPSWPHLVGPKLVLPAHSEVDKTDGKTDPFPKGDVRNDELRARLYQAIGGAPMEDVKLEARYQANAAALGAKKYKAKLTQPYYTGSVLVCERGVVTTDAEIATNVIDDWETYHREHGTLERY